ncbi:MAG: nickel-dependent lactate racemase [Acidobacteriota bacterium]|nr:nickel-dependent lactate racemase [Acidobacteriota bacterium]
MALQLRRKTHESIIYIDRGSAPRIIPFGEDFILEDLPIGTRMIYPNPPIKGLPNREAAIRYAVNHPIDAKPLYAQLEPGMRVTIAIDDISMPLPPMATPDVRQTMLEVILEQCAANGVDDIHLIIAISLHRRMTAWEMERMVGSKIFNEFYPDRYYNHDAEDDENLVTIGHTRHDEPLRINKRAIESDLLIYANINFVPMNGGHKSVAVGLCDYESLRAHHEPQTIRDSDSYMDPQASELTHKIDRLGKLVDEHCNVFHIETALNSRMFSDGYDILTRNEDEFSFMDRMKWEAMKRTFSNLPRGARRKLLHQIPAQYELIACYAGATDPVHEKILEKNYQQFEIPVKGQCDILISGIPDISPYNVYSSLNPLLVQVMALGYHFNMYRNKPLVRKGGVMIVSHPCFDEFDHNQHAPYIEFFHRLLSESRDAFYLREKYEREFATNPNYIEMYRRGNAYHGAHPFFMWYWGENGRQHVGKVIVAGAENAHVPEMLGWERADNMTEAIAQARSFMGRNAEITMLHQPIIGLCNVTD